MNDFELGFLVTKSSINLKIIRPSVSAFGMVKIILVELRSFNADSNSFICFLAVEFSKVTGWKVTNKFFFPNLKSIDF